MEWTSTPASAAATSRAESTPTGCIVSGSTTTRWLVPCSFMSSTARSSESRPETTTTGVAAEPPAVRSSRPAEEAALTRSRSVTIPHIDSPGSRSSADSKTTTQCTLYDANIRATVRRGVVGGHVSTPGCITSAILRAVSSERVSALVAIVTSLFSDIVRQRSASRIRVDAEPGGGKAPIPTRLRLSRNHKRATP